MSIQDLEEHGILLPRKAWGKMALSTSVNKAALSVAFFLGALSCVLMILGEGGLLTWLGALLFIIFLLVFTLISNQGIDRQSRQCEELLQKQ